MREPRLTKEQFSERFVEHMLKRAGAEFDGGLGEIAAAALRAEEARRG